MSSIDPPYTCNQEHEVFASVLTFGLVVGLFLSYVPQHVKIISSGRSEGFSPWFLLLGSTSSSAAMLNMFTMQWNVIKCCKYLNAGRCVESLGGIFQVSVQWALFTTIFILFMIYYPADKKYVKVNAIPERPPVRTNVKADEWHLAIVLSWVTAAHFFLSAIYTGFLIHTTKVPPGGTYPTDQVKLWATFLGVTSAAFAVIQYLPQLRRTYRAKLVGAISIPMMLVQSPGAAVMVISIAMREGTDWTSWAMYAASGIMQSSLLVMCFVWKIRQRRLGVDDFGNPISKDGVTPATSAGVPEEAENERIATEETPLLVGTKPVRGE